VSWLEIPSRRAGEGNWERTGRGDAAFSLFMRFLNSNRKIYEKLELGVTCTKQTLGPFSNRKKNALFAKYTVRFRTPVLLAKWDLK
jgi:hypothetical protein